KEATLPTAGFYSATLSTTPAFQWPALSPPHPRGDATPKLWPSYRNLLVRMFDQNQTDVVGRPEELPELYAFDAAIEREAKNLAEDQAEMPAQDDMLRRVRAQRDRISEIFDRAGMRSEWFRSDDALTHGRDRFQRAFAE
ncbi:hypothetical protein, partial [Sphingomonas sp. UYEF23]|uniref:hypothetical protein n=1 Tax=Sphingomonas sp. UYEF23 TaxID=1756408 RepID=UPI003397300C